MNKGIRKTTPVTVDGITFRSKFKSNVYLYLKSKDITPQFESERFLPNIQMIISMNMP